MLSSLTIQNFGLIDNASVDFCSKLNILTGETGAGKSILIDGLRFALGERIKHSQIRDKRKPCVIEAVFELKGSILCRHPLFSDYLKGDSTLIIHRQYLPDGRTKIKINGLSITVAQLKEIGNHLIDFHGAHDHQMLLSQEAHIGILDQLTSFSGKKEIYLSKYKEYVTLQNQLKELKGMAHSRERDLDLLSHQIKECEQVPLEQQRYEDVCQDLAKIDNAEKLYASASSLLKIFEGEQIGISEIVQQAFSPLKNLTQIDEKTQKFDAYLTSIQENSDQLIMELRDYLDSLSFQPNEASEINRKHDIYEDIKRKYGPTIEEASQFYLDAKSKYELLMDIEHNDEELDKKIQKCGSELGKIADGLSIDRKKTAVSLKKTIEKELKDLGITHVDFEARITPVDFNENGRDEVVFYISPNAGEDLKPLAEIVSSGEAARLMLALKKALTKVDPIPVLIFDEIDAQIGGRLGTITGNKLKELSCDRQVVLITHLAQIASFADEHFKVTKQVQSGRTITKVVKLPKDERVNELSQMMGAQKDSKVTKIHAEELLAKAQKI